MENTKVVLFSNYDKINSQYDMTGNELSKHNIIGCNYCLLTHPLWYHAFMHTILTSSTIVTVLEDL